MSVDTCCLWGTLFSYFLDDDVVAMAGARLLRVGVVEAIGSLSACAGNGTLQVIRLA